MERYEQYDIVKHHWAWLMIILFSASLIGWAIMMHALVPDAPRRWNFGQLPDTPGESRFSTTEPPLREPPPVQLTPLPEAHHGVPAVRQSNDTVHSHHSSPATSAESGETQ